MRRFDISDYEREVIEVFVQRRNVQRQVEFRRERDAAEAAKPKTPWGQPQDGPVAQVRAVVDAD